MARDRVGVATLVAVVVLLLVAPATGAITGPSHTASSGTTYQTNSGLAVTLGDQREVEAVPFADDQTFRSDGVTISANGTADVTVTDQTFSAGTMQLASIDATSTPITATRDTLNTEVTVSGGATALIVHNVTVGDNETDIEVVAASETNLTVGGVPADIGLQAVDSNGDVIAGTTDTDNGQAELTIPTGSYSLRLQKGPSELEIRNLKTQELIRNTSDPITVEVEFFAADGEVISRSTTDGTIDLAGLPADQRFSVTVEAGTDFVTRQVIIPSILEQDTAFVLPKANTTTVQPRFVLEDPSQRFDTEDSEILIERPIEQGNDTQFVAVAGDRVGLQGFNPVLEQGQRYRIRVRDPTSGRERQLGAFTPTVTERVTLEVTDVEFDSVSETDGLEWTARYVEGDNQDTIEFILRDSQPTQSVEYEIYPRGEPNNTLVSDSATGNVTISEAVPPSQNDSVFVVEFDLERGNGETVSAQRQVSSDSLPVGPSGLAQNWQTVIAMLILVGVAGLFGAANPGVGGIATAMTGGVFFLLGWLPDDTGGLMVGLAIFIAVLSYGARRARGATA
jgi:hypothetical protein